MRLTAILLPSGRVVFPVVAQRRVNVPEKVIVVVRFDSCWMSSFGRVHPRGGWYQRHLFEDATRDSVENFGKVHA